MARKAMDEATKKRVRAGRLLQKGRTPAEIALDVGVARQTVYTWKALFEEGGIDALRAVPLRGRQARLDETQRDELRRANLLNPTENGFGTELWTLKRVDADVQSPPPGIVFHSASAIDEAAVAQVQTDLRRHILRAFVGQGLIEKAGAKEMLGYQHSGFSVDASVLIEADDRAALERLLRYCARPPFAWERLRKEGAALVPPPRTHRRTVFGRC